MASPGGEEEGEEVDWSELGPDLLLLMSESLTTVIDYIRFRAVCPSWRSATTPRPQHLPCQSPWLFWQIELYEQGEERESAGHTCSYFSIPEQRYYRLALPEARGMQPLGSCHGWMVMLECQLEHPPISLLNPITRARIRIPSLPLSGLVFKTVFSSPDSLPLSVMAIFAFDKQLAICKSGDQAWTMLATTPFHDAILYNGRFFVVDADRRLFVCDPDHPSAMMMEITCGGIEIPPEVGYKVYYLVESCGDLLLVIKHFLRYYRVDRRPVPVTQRFQVFKLNLDGQKTEWVEITNLGDRVLFLGLNQSISLSATRHLGWKGNHIYFISDYKLPGYISHNCECNVFNLEDGSIEPALLPSLRYELPSFWITPTLR